VTDPSGFARWPLLAASTTLAGAGLALDLTSPDAAPFAVACLMLAACAFGAFLYAEGARHRDWTHAERSRSVTPAFTDSDDTPDG
jgi:hypothetical protein